MKKIKGRIMSPSLGATPQGPILQMKTLRLRLPRGCAAGVQGATLTGISLWLKLDPEKVWPRAESPALGGPLTPFLVFTKSPWTDFLLSPSRLPPQPWRRSLWALGGECEHVSFQTPPLYLRM